MTKLIISSEEIYFSIMVDIHHYIGFRCTAQGLDIYKV